MRRFNLFALLAVLLALAVAAVACDPGDPVEDDTLDDEDDAEVDVDDDPDDADVADGDELVAAIAGEPDQLDPHLTTAYPSFQVLENVYDTLVQPDADLEFEPALATDWETSDDELTWTFELREDVTWHDGEAFTADDVVYSYERIMDPDVGAANAFRFESVEEVTAVDDLRVEIELSRPTPGLLANLGGFKGMAIIPDGSAEADAEGAEEVDEDEVDDAAPEDTDEITTITEPVGTGPFRFESFNEGVGAELSAFEDYWGGAPDVAGVEFQFIPEGTTAITALETGEVDWTDNIPPQDVEGILDDDDLVAEAVPSNDFWYVAFNFDREPFDVDEVRQALAFGFDRADVAAAAQFDAATVNQTAIPEGDPFHHDYAPFDHDPDQAESLLDDAGVDDLTIDLMVTDEFEETIQAAQVLEAQWGEIGVDTDIRVEDFGTWLDEQGEGNFDAFLLGWLGNIAPEDYYFNQHVSDGDFNFHGFSDDDVDDLLTAAREETDEDERKALFDEAVEIIVDRVSYLYLYNPDVVHAWQPAVEGYEVRTDRAIRFENVSLDR